MNITQIKIKKGETIIKYEENSNNKKQKETVFKSSEEAIDEWNNCLQVLKPYALKLLELDEIHNINDYSDWLDVISISITHEESGIGIVVSLQKKIEDCDCPFCFNTPYMPPMRNELQENFLDWETTEIVENLMEKAKCFMKGDYNIQTDIEQYINK